MYLNILYILRQILDQYHPSLVSYIVQMYLHFYVYSDIQQKYLNMIIWHIYYPITSNHCCDTFKIHAKIIFKAAVWSTEAFITNTFQIVVQLKSYLFLWVKTLCKISEKKWEERERKNADNSGHYVLSARPKGKAHTLLGPIPIWLSDSCPITFW